MSSKTDEVGREGVWRGEGQWGKGSCLLGTVHMGYIKSVLVISVKYF